MQISKRYRVLKKASLLPCQEPALNSRSVNFMHKQAKHIDDVKVETNIWLEFVMSNFAEKFHRWDCYM